MPRDTAALSALDADRALRRLLRSMLLPRNVGVRKMEMQEFYEVICLPVLVWTSVGGMGVRGIAKRNHGMG